MLNTDDCILTADKRDRRSRQRSLVGVGSELNGSGMGMGMVSLKLPQSIGRGETL